MNYLKRKKISFIPYVSKIKGFEVTGIGEVPVVMFGCLDDSIIDYTIHGAGDKLSGVGDKTVNLFDSTQLLNVSGWSADENGVYTGKIATLWSVFGKDGQFALDIPEDAPRISISWEGKNETVNATTFSFVFYYADGTSSQVITQYIRTTEWESYRVQSTPGKRVVAIKAGYSKSDNIFLKNIQITATAEYLEYEPFGKFKIPVLVSDEGGCEVKKNIYLEEPLCTGESINMKKHSLPEFPTFEGTTIFDVGTEVKPAEVKITYYSSFK